MKKANLIDWQKTKEGDEEKSRPTRLQAETEKAAPFGSLHFELFNNSLATRSACLLPPRPPSRPRDLTPGRDSLRGLFFRRRAPLDSLHWTRSHTEARSRHLCSADSGRAATTSSCCYCCCCCCLSKKYG